MGASGPKAPGAGAPETELAEVEITPEMIEVGVSKLFEFDITQPVEVEIKVALSEAFRAMILARS